MPTPTFTIKIKAGSALMDRIRAMADYLDVSAGHFVENAIESELHRQESHRTKEDITLAELQQHVLNTGQSLEVIMDSEGEGVQTCHLCMKAIPEIGKFDGPVLCDNCHDLAQGARLEKMDPRRH